MATILEGMVTSPENLDWQGILGPGKIRFFDFSLPVGYLQPDTGPTRCRSVSVSEAEVAADRFEVEMFFQKVGHRAIKGILMFTPQAR